MPKVIGYMVIVFVLFIGLFVIPYLITKLLLLALYEVFKLNLNNQFWFIFFILYGLLILFNKVFKIQVK